MRAKPVAVCLPWRLTHILQSKVCLCFWFSWFALMCVRRCLLLFTLIFFVIFCDQIRVSSTTPQLFFYMFSFLFHFYYQFISFVHCFLFFTVLFKLFFLFVFVSFIFCVWLNLFNFGIFCFFLCFIVFTSLFSFKLYWLFSFKLLILSMIIFYKRYIDRWLLKFIVNERRCWIFRYFCNLFLLQFIRFNISNFMSVMCWWLVNVVEYRTMCSHLWLLFEIIIVELATFFLFTN